LRALRPGRFWLGLAADFTLVRRALFVCHIDSFPSVQPIVCVPRLGGVVGGRAVLDTGACMATALAGGLKLCTAH
jgi:hypothetical protein